MPLPLILASRSPRRQQLLTEVGYRFSVLPASEAAECGVCAGESAAQLVSRLARQKAADVAPRVDRGVILACDTVAACQGEILGKPANEQHARRMLQSLRGQRHHVYTGMCLWRRPDDLIMADVATTVLRMDVLSDREIDEYVKSGLWEGKAGAFGYQDRHGWLHIEQGSESNVVGLPLELLAALLPRALEGESLEC